MELRECPYCGSKSIREEYKFKDIITRYHSRYCITCHDCEASVSRRIKEKAIKAWNNRHEPKHETVEQWVERFKDMPGFISIDLLFHKDGTHITKQEYGRILINTICNELIEKYGKPEGNR